MIARFFTWFRARTRREQLLLQAAAFLAFGVIAPLWAYGAAAAFRADAAQSLAAAQDLRAEVARLAEAAPPAAALSADPSLRGRALAAADAEGLTPARIEPAGADRVRIAFAPASSVRLYRWMAAMGRSGAVIASAAIIRSGEGDTVTGEFEVAAGP